MLKYGSSRYKNYIQMAHPEGVEPPTAWFEAKCSIQLSYGCLMIFKN